MKWLISWGIIMADIALASESGGKYTFRRLTDTYPNGSTESYCYCEKSFGNLTRAECYNLVKSCGVSSMEPQKDINQTE